MNVGSALKRISISHPEMEVSVIGNFDVTNGSIQPAFSTSGPWYNYFTGDTLNVSDTDTTITLKPGEFHIYTTQKFEAPEEGLLPGSITPPIQDPPGEFKLHQNYPNPFNPTTTISYELTERAQVNLQVYNILGQKIISMDMGEQLPGSHVVTLDASGFSSGLYFYRLNAGSRSSTRKMLLIK